MLRSLLEALTGLPLRHQRRGYALTGQPAPHSSAPSTGMNRNPRWVPQVRILSGAPEHLFYLLLLSSRAPTPPEMRQPGPLPRRPTGPGRRVRVLDAGVPTDIMLRAEVGLRLLLAPSPNRAHASLRAESRGGLTRRSEPRGPRHLNGGRVKQLGSRLARMALAISLAASAGLVTASPVAASCNPQRVDNGLYYSAGTQQTLSGITGVMSTIRTYRPYVSANGFSYAWVMLPGPGNLQWIQIGPYASATRMTTTVQVDNAFPNGPVQWDFAATAVGSSHTYDVLRAPGDPHSYAAMMDGQILISYSLAYTAPGAQIYAEINTFATQLMGDSSTKEYFNVNQLRNSAGSWIHVTSGVGATNTHFAYSGTGYSFYTWDMCK